MRIVYAWLPHACLSHFLSLVLVLSAVSSHDWVQRLRSIDLVLTWQSWFLSLSFWAAVSGALKLSTAISGWKGSRLGNLTVGILRRPVPSEKYRPKYKHLKIRRYKSSKPKASTSKICRRYEWSLGTWRQISPSNVMCGTWFRSPSCCQGVFCIRKSVMRFEHWETCMHACIYTTEKTAEAGWRL